MFKEASIFVYKIHKTYQKKTCFYVLIRGYGNDGTITVTKSLKHITYLAYNNTSDKNLKENNKIKTETHTIHSILLFKVAIIELYNLVTN